MGQVRPGDACEKATEGGSMIPGGPSPSTPLTGPRSSIIRQRTCATARCTSVLADDTGEAGMRDLLCCKSRHVTDSHSLAARELVNRRRLPPSWRCTMLTGSDHICDSASAARSASHGHAARPPTCAKGPSVSVRTRSRGIFAASARPLSPANMAGSILRRTLGLRRRPGPRCQ